ncbi:Clustered mitochondria protein [Glycine max]|nr:Clustered mitochondria protein [Glycine max]KAH1224815.1 Clustered mitochondria protein [Glycine max]
MAMSQSACKETGMKSCSLVENFLVHLLRRILRDRALYKVTSDFVDAAINGAIGVISGCIPPINLTDPECFHMYVHNNIFFSFAIDADLEKLSKKLVDANSKSWSSSSLQSSSDKDSIPVHGESQVPNGGKDDGSSSEDLNSTEITQDVSPEAQLAENEQATYASANNDLKGTKAYQEADVPGLYNLTKKLMFLAQREQLQEGSFATPNAFVPAWKNSGDPRRKALPKLSSAISRILFNRKMMDFSRVFYFLLVVLWPECGWQPVSLTDMITSSAVKKVYRKANLCIHPDKVQQKGATLEQKYTAEKVFDILKVNVQILNVHDSLRSDKDSDEHLERKILDPERLSRVESIFGNLSETIKIYGPWSSAWVGEAGGAYNSVLWHRLMGKKVLTVSSDVHIKDFYLQLGNMVYKVFKFLTSF